SGWLPAAGRAAARRWPAPPPGPARSARAANPAGRSVAPRRGAAATASWPGHAIVGRTHRRRRLLVTFGRARRRPVGEGPGLAVAVEALEATDLRQVAAQAVAKIHQRAVRLALDQAHQQLHDHQAEQ